MHTKDQGLHPWPDPAPESQSDSRDDSAKRHVVAVVKK